MGLPINHFIAAVNANDIVQHYLKTGSFEPKPSIETISNAMDVGNPSNFNRIVELFGHDRTEILKIIESYSISDVLIEEGIREVYRKYGYLIDPHGAVGYQALKDVKNRSDNKNHSIILETAHPAKFLDIVSPVIDKNIDMPDRLQECLKKQKNSILVSDDYSDFKSALLNWLQ